jgi:hypothetical protein
MDVAATTTREDNITYKTTGELRAAAGEIYLRKEKKGGAKFKSTRNMVLSTLLLGQLDSRVTCKRAIYDRSSE